MMCVLYLLLSFLPLEILSRALTRQSLTHRLSLPTTSNSLHTTIMPPVSNLHAGLSNHIAPGDSRHIICRAWLHKVHPPRLTDLFLDQSNSVVQEKLAWQRGSRGRRHANSGSFRVHGHQMRVGCVLGTCQVQNLSHRLYQLIGQSGREDSSPINPRSPHSYG